MEVGYYGMPLGFRFHPTDQELVSSYLRDRALSGKPLGNPLDGFNYWTDSLWMSDSLIKKFGIGVSLGLLLCRTDPLPAFHFAAPQVSTACPPVMSMYVLLGSFPILMH
ncbi:hypothetical protein ACFXTH_031891 [Malus domestica]